MTKLYRLWIDSLVFPFLNDCVDVWADTSKTNLQPWCTLQKRVIRRMNNTGDLEHTKKLFTLSHRRLQKVCGKRTVGKPWPLTLTELWAAALGHLLKVCESAVSVECDQGTQFNTINEPEHIICRFHTVSEFSQSLWKPCCWQSMIQQQKDEENSDLHTNIESSSQCCVEDTCQHSTQQHLNLCYTQHFTLLHHQNLLENSQTTQETKHNWVYVWIRLKEHSVKSGQSHISLI